MHKSFCLIVCLSLLTLGVSTFASDTEHPIKRNVKVWAFTSNKPTLISGFTFDKDWNKYNREKDQLQVQ